MKAINNRDNKKKLILEYLPGNIYFLQMQCAMGNVFCPALS